MRTVYAKLDSLGLSAGDEVTIHLCNSVGISVNALFSLPSIVVCDDSLFRVSLLENKKIQFESYYKLTLPSELHFTFRVPVSFENRPHELTSLMKMGCHSQTVTQEGLHPDFIEKLDFYFIGKESHFTNAQQDLVDMYIFYANSVVDDDIGTIDIVQKMDEYLAQKETKDG